MSLAISVYLETLRVLEGKGLSKEAMKKLLERHEELTDYAFELEAEQRKKRDGIAVWDGPKRRSVLPERPIRRRTLLEGKTAKIECNDDEGDNDAC
jgi:hypothetical protein